MPVFSELKRSLRLRHVSLCLSLSVLPAEKKLYKIYMEKLYRYIRYETLKVTSCNSGCNLWSRFSGSRYLRTHWSSVYSWSVVTHERTNQSESQSSVVCDEPSTTSSSLFHDAYRRENPPLSSNKLTLTIAVAMFESERVKLGFDVSLHEICVQILQIISVMLLKISNCVN